MSLVIKRFEERPEPPCHGRPKTEWCDKDGPGGFMGHTCWGKMGKKTLGELLPKIIEPNVEAVLQALFRYHTSGALVATLVAFHEARGNVTCARLLSETLEVREGTIYVRGEPPLVTTMATPLSPVNIQEDYRRAGPWDFSMDL